MMARSTDALINPELLVWARKSIGLTPEDAAKKISVKQERLESWEKGELKPTIKQLRKLGNIYKRPIAVFYLSGKPKDFLPIRDFRRLSKKIEAVRSPQLHLEIRRAHDRRQLAIELFEDLEGEAPKFSATATLSENPEALAQRIRNLLGITRKIQSNFNHDYEAFNWWRTSLEDAGVLVFQARGVELSEMRGFSIIESPFPVIVVNIKDPPIARIFTMLHEFAHAMLGLSGLCDVDERFDRAPEDQRIEVFCNRVAGEALVTKEDLLGEDAVRRKGQKAEWSNREILELAKTYRVSREVLLRRLLICGRTTREFYQEKRRDLMKEFEASGKKKKGGFAPPYRIALSTAGPLFTRLVLRSYYQENITSRDLSDFLNVKLKHVSRIEKEVMGFSEFGVAN